MALTTAQQQLIQADFERYLQHLGERQQAFDFDTFLLFAASITNFYGGSDLIQAHQRENMAEELLRLFNAGMGNRISSEDLRALQHLILSDTDINYSLLNPIFGGSKP